MNSLLEERYVSTYKFASFFLNSVWFKGTGCEMKTPMKRRNPYTQTSTTIKRTKIIRSTPAILSENLQGNSFLYSTIVSPIAKTIINKLENKYGYNLPFSAKKPQYVVIYCCNYNVNCILYLFRFYDAMRTLIKKEVQQHTTNKSNHKTLFA